MRLIPTHPPGQANRKARAFEAEIARRRSEGYTCAAIRAALADVGVEVSLSTVQRDATRCSRRPQPTPAVTEVAVAAKTDSAPAYAPRALDSAIPAGDPRTGKQIAADFVSRRITDPLLRNRSTHEVAVINFSGNVGKTTVARHLLAPRIDGAKVVAVESINADDAKPRRYEDASSHLPRPNVQIASGVSGQGSNAGSWVQAVASRVSPREDLTQPGHDSCSPAGSSRA